MRRNLLEMKLDVLNVINGKPLIITHIMYKTHIKGTLLKEMISNLEEQKLIQAILPDDREVFGSHPKLRKRYKKVRYGLTEQGRTILQQATQLKNFLESAP